MARYPCRGFPTMQRAPGGSPEVGGASWKWCSLRVNLQDEGTWYTHERAAQKRTHREGEADSELSCALKA